MYVYAVVMRGGIKRRFRVHCSFYLPAYVAEPFICLCSLGELLPFYKRKKGVSCCSACLSRLERGVTPPRLYSTAPAHLACVCL